MKSSLKMLGATLRRLSNKVARIKYHVQVPLITRLLSTGNVQCSDKFSKLLLDDLPKKRVPIDEENSSSEVPH
jgi:hypothetical protein